MLLLDTALLVEDLQQTLIRLLSNWSKKSSIPSNKRSIATKLKELNNIGQKALKLKNLEIRGIVYNAEMHGLFKDCKN